MTVGSSLPHDELIMKIDSLVKDGKIKADVVAQIGEGKYIPKNIEYVRFAPSLEDYYRKANIIISNCGAGTIMENVTRGRRLIVIQNPDITGGHEWEIVTKMEKGEHLIWCKGLDELKSSIHSASTMEFKRFEPKQLILSDLINEITSSK
ncbi:MAG: hypothetical protein KAU48_03195 [Candidatus Thorarchaeota archaeon]|nr:hypothetical protein [Candidatus Thorarchaeota archaeon]